jgi:hypothetical protein
MIIKAPNDFSKYLHLPKLFLAGSIEMGKAINWQNEVENSLNNDKILILNPRRDDWDSSWIQDISNPQFNQQVNWELSALESSDLIAMFLQPNTQSPISLLELGLFKNKNLIVCCPNGFWRKGNVDIVCKKYNIKQVNSINELKSETLNWANNLNKK